MLAAVRCGLLLLYEYSHTEGVFRITDIHLSPVLLYDLPHIPQADPMGASVILIGLKVPALLCYLVLF